MKECIYKLEKYLHKIITVFQKTIELSTDENEIKIISLKVAEKEFLQIFLLKTVNFCLVPQSLDLVKKKPKMLETILNPRQILKVIQIIHRKALRTPVILAFKIPNFIRLFENIN